MVLMAIMTTASAYVLQSSVLMPRSTPSAHRHGGATMEYGDNCYEGALEPLPENVYEVSIQRPLGIGFEECGPIVGMSGVQVNQIVEQGNAWKGKQVLANVGGSNVAVDGKVAIGDKLIGVTAIQFISAKWERKMFDCRKWGACHALCHASQSAGQSIGRSISGSVSQSVRRPLPCMLLSTHAEVSH